MSKHINSCTGPLATAALGRTLMHEHVLVGFPGWFMDVRQPPFRRQEAVERVTEAFQALHAYGVRTVVDPCPMDMGRNVELIAEVSQRSGINLICTTGAYTEQEGIPFMFRQFDVNEIADIYIREIEDGIGNSGIKPGLIKVATGDGRVSDYERKLLTAAARASKATGVPLLSHTENCSCGHDQVDIVTGEGLEASRILVGHSDGRDDHEYQSGIAARGAYVGFDRFGLEMIVPDEVRMRNLAQMVAAGHRSRVIVSHDMVHCLLGHPMGMAGLDVSKIAPNWRMTHLFENIFPKLESAGVGREDIDHILIDNPRRFFGT